MDVFLFLHIYGCFVAANIVGIKGSPFLRSLRHYDDARTHDLDIGNLNANAVALEKEAVEIHRTINDLAIQKNIDELKNEEFKLPTGMFFGKEDYYTEMKARSENVESLFDHGLDLPDTLKYDSDLGIPPTTSSNMTHGDSSDLLKSQKHFLNSLMDKSQQGIDTLNSIDEGMRIRRQKRSKLSKNDAAGNVESSDEKLTSAANVSEVSTINTPTEGGPLFPGTESKTQDKLKTTPKSQASSSTYNSTTAVEASVSIKLRSSNTKANRIGRGALDYTTPLHNSNTDIESNSTTVSSQKSTDQSSRSPTTVWTITPEKKQKVLTTLPATTRKTSLAQKSPSTQSETHTTNMAADSTTSSTTTSSTRATKTTMATTKEKNDDMGTTVLTTTQNRSATVKGGNTLSEESYSHFQAEVIFLVLLGIIGGLLAGVMVVMCVAMYAGCYQRKTNFSHFLQFYEYQ